MNFLKVSVLVIFSIFSARSFAEAGFKSGNNFSVRPVKGVVTLHCINGRIGESPSRTYNCNNNYISPSSHSRFITDSGIEAKKVRLTATWENGKVKSKTKKWSSKKGQSKNFNLWITTLFQRPLLGYGVNQVQYEMLSKSGDVLEVGIFEANIERRPAVNCGHRSYNVYNSSDCSFPATYCRRMYQEGHGCR